MAEEAGDTVATLASLLTRVTTRPPEGAGWLNVAVALNVRPTPRSGPSRVRLMARCKGTIWMALRAERGVNRELPGVALRVKALPERLEKTAKSPTGVLAPKSEVELAGT